MDNLIYPDHELWLWTVQNRIDSILDSLGLMIDAKTNAEKRFWYTLAQDDLIRLECLFTHESHTKLFYYRVFKRLELKIRSLQQEMEWPVITQSTTVYKWME